MAREMKHSGVEWIGDIPASWNMSKLLWCLEEIKEKNNPIKTTNVLSLTNKLGVIPYEEKGNQGNKAKEDYTQYGLAFEDTLVINSMNVLIGSVGISKYYGCVSPVYYVYKNTDKADLRFINYIFQNVGFQKELRKYANGILEIRMRISSHDMLRRTIPLPSLGEQNRISDFLDSECSRIDAVIEQTRASIEEYKKLKQSVITQTVTKGIRPDRLMKETGNKWIPTIPTEWKLTRVGLHFDIILGKMLCSNQLSDDYTLEPYYCAANVHFDGVTNDGLKQMWFSSSEKKQYLVSVGDLLVVEGGAGAGGCAVVKEMQQPTYIQNSIMIVRPRKSSNNRYLGYLLESLVKSGYIDVACNKATIPHFTKDKLANVPMPISSEQKEIADYLDSQLKDVDILISKKEVFLAELDTYKKSLIFEYVTGKKEVPA